MTVPPEILLALFSSAPAAADMPTGTPLVIEVEQGFAAAARVPVEVLVDMIVPGGDSDLAWDYDSDPWPPCSFG